MLHRRRPVTVRSSGRQLAVTGPAGAPVRVVGPGGAVDEAALDHFGDELAATALGVGLPGRGGLVLWDREPGEHRVEVGRRFRRVVVVRGDDGPDEAAAARVRAQRLAPGYGYLAVRDGTLLSCVVGLPDPARWGPGPYPTVLHYSPYAPSRPGVLHGRPELDDTMDTEANVARLLGFAVVGLNLRGTGGSGGAMRMWDRTHGLDGHDAVEAVAAQPWCRSVGMIGRSAPGFTQLLVASTEPPSLAAITPAAVLARGHGPGRGPGGLQNSWVRKRLSGWSVGEVDDVPLDAHPPRYEPGGWDAWVVDRVAEGDRTCLENQLLHGQSIGPLEEQEDPSDEPDTSVRTSPILWAPTIRCPTLLVGSWQDQESGPGWSDLVAAFPATTDVRLVGSNGTHEETRFPELTARWIGFLAEHLGASPFDDPAEAEAYLQAATAPQLGANRLPLASPPTPTEPVVLRLDHGAGPGGPGLPTAAVHVTLPAWPPPTARPRRWHLTAGGLADEPAEEDRLSFTWDPSVVPPTSAPDDGFDVNAPSPPYDWREPPPGFGLALATPPFEQDALLCGPSSVDLALRCSAPDVDLEVTLGELRPDGWETFLQSGWLRASARHLLVERSTELQPILSHQRRHEAPLAPGGWIPVRIPVPAVAHLLRAGSHLVLRIEAPGGTQPSWTFAPRWPGARHDGQPIRVDVGPGSSLVVPLVGADDLPALPPLPPPGALRRQPSRRPGRLIPAPTSARSSTTPPP